MATTPVQRKVTPIDPMFPIPEGTDELVYGTRSETDALANATGPVDSYTGQAVDPTLVVPVQTTGQSTVPSPDIIGIVSQQVRRAPSGENVIDVVVQTSDIVGAIRYEFRVTKT
jgi:hypothetical protein